MNATWYEFVGWFVDYQLLAGGLLAATLAAAWLLKQPAHRMAALRPALVGLAALAVLCAAPGWSLIHLGGPAAEPIAAAAPTPPVMQATPTVEAPVLAAHPPLARPSVPPQFTAEPTTLPAAAPPSESVQAAGPPQALGWGSATFLLGAAVVALWLAAGALQARRLLRRAQPAPAELAAVLSRLIEGAPAPRLLVSEEIAVAAAVGWRRPTILLPRATVSTAADGAPASDLAAVLAHEWAHIRHGDLRTLAAARWLLPLLWPQPLFWLLRRIIRLDQETLADAAAAELTSRQDYAQRLVAWARQTTGSPTPRLAAAVGLWENPSQLKRRVMTLLDEKFQVLRNCSRRWRIGCQLVALLAAAGLSVVTLQPADATRPGAVDETELSASQQQTLRDALARITVLSGREDVQDVAKWGAAIRSIVEIGPAAVPGVIEALDAANEDHPIRKLAFTLRAIGDPRAVPALIRALPRTHLPPASDFGLRCEDQELCKFLQQHQDGGAAGEFVNYHRAFREVIAALHKLTGVDQRDMELNFAICDGDARQRALQAQQYQLLAARWAAWWAEHGDELIEDERYLAVELPKLPNELPAGSYDVGPPSGPDTIFGDAHGDFVVTAMEDAIGYCFLDLDTGRQASWPQDLPSPTGLDIDAPVLRQWAEAQGFDLVGYHAADFEIENVAVAANGVKRFAVAPLGLKIWRLEDAEFSALPAALRGETTYPLRRPSVKLEARLVDDSGPYLSPRPPANAYLYLTREGTFGVMELTEPILGVPPFPRPGVYIRFASIFDAPDAEKSNPLRLPFSVREATESITPRFDVEQPVPAPRRTMPSFDSELPVGALPGVWTLEVKKRDDGESSLAGGIDAPASSHAPGGLGASTLDGDLDAAAGAAPPVQASSFGLTHDTLVAGKVRAFHANHRPQPNNVTGLCIDEAGHPVADVEVTLYLYETGGDATPARVLGKVATGADGIYRFTNVIDAAKVFPDGLPDENFLTPPTKLVALIARKEGMASAWDNDLALRILQHGDAGAKVMKPAATLRGRVVDGAGRPIAGATVRANEYLSIPGVALGSAVTDDAGRYEINDIEAYDAAAARQAHEARVAQMQASMSTDQLEMMRAASFSGTLEFQPRTLLVQHPDYVLGRATIDEIPGEVNAQLSPGGTLTGRVVRRGPAGDEPAGNCAVYAALIPDEATKKPEKNEWSNDFVPWSLAMVSVAQTDANGTYRVRSLPGGAYSVDVDGGGPWVTAGLAEISVAAGETTEAPEISLTHGGVFRVQLVDAETSEPLKFHQPRKGWISASPSVMRHRVSVGNGAVEFEANGTGERHVAPGSYRITATMPNEQDKEGATLTSLDPAKTKFTDLPVYKIAEGETVEITLPMRRETARVTGAVFRAETQPSEPADATPDESDEPAE